MFVYNDVHNHSDYYERNDCNPHIRFCSCSELLIHFCVFFHSFVRFLPEGDAEERIDDSTESQHAVDEPCLGIKTGLYVFHFLFMDSSSIESIFEQLFSKLYRRTDIFPLSCFYFFRWIWHTFETFTLRDLNRSSSHGFVLLLFHRLYNNFDYPVYFIYQINSK